MECVCLILDFFLLIRFSVMSLAFQNTEDEKNKYYY